jgi:putative NIF3 family GTP cyclohydrolase 1 type 2
MKAIDLHYWLETHAPPHTPEDKVDGIMAGDPNAKVNGVAITWLPNLDVLKRSAAAGLNFVIAHEPLFYWHPYYYPAGDEFHIPAGDLERKKATPPGRAKQAVIDSANLVVYRMHDGWDQFPAHGMGFSLARLLGWSDYSVSDRYIYALPPVRLADLATTVAVKLGKKGTRFVGDPDQIVRRVTLDWGSPGAIDILLRAQANGCDAAITGEVVEWRDIEFARDLGISLITAGHYATETIGMRSFHSWFQNQMRATHPALPIEYVDCHDPDHFAPGAS